jgi:dihydrofolate reductase
MRKLVAAINMTVDGFCDHTAGIVDDEIHQHYTELIRSADTILYGRITYQLMESYWPTVVTNPTGNKPTDDFAVAIDKISKIVFSHTLKNLEWETASLASRGITEEVLELKKKAGTDILVGSPGLIVNCMKLNIVDELQLCIHPLILGKGLTLFKDMNDSIHLKLLKTKTFRCGAVIFYYEPTKNDN